MRRQTLLLLAVLLLAASIAGIAAAKEVTVKVYHARTTPVYQKLPNGEVVKMYADLYYPDKLVEIMTPDGRLILGTAKVVVHCNYTGPWGANVVLYVIDPSFHIDPTTFMPAGYVHLWAVGGCVIGGGASRASISPHWGPVAVCNNVTLQPQLDYFNAMKKYYGAVVPAKIFVGVRIQLYSNKTYAGVYGDVEGGIIHVYTTNATSPLVKVILAEPVKLVKEHETPDPAAYGAAAAIVVLLVYTLYQFAYRMRRRRR